MANDDFSLVKPVYKILHEVGAGGAASAWRECIKPCVLVIQMNVGHLLECEAAIMRHGGSQACI